MKGTGEENGRLKRHCRKQGGGYVSRKEIDGISSYRSDRDANTHILYMLVLGTQL